MIGRVVCHWPRNVAGWLFLPQHCPSLLGAGGKMLRILSRDGAGRQRLSGRRHPPRHPCLRRPAGRAPGCPTGLIASNAEYGMAIRRVYAVCRTGSASAGVHDLLLHRHLWQRRRHGQDVPCARARPRQASRPADRRPLQYDAASVESVVAGRANVFIFLDLNTSNTTYKAVQRSAHVVSIGPMLQGCASR
jgi:hypothetical protein